MIIFHYLHYFFYFIFINLILSQSDCNNRYLEYMYDINIDYDIQYGQNINQNIIGNQINQDLFMNILSY